LAQELHKQQETAQPQRRACGQIIMQMIGARSVDPKTSKAFLGSCQVQSDPSLGQPELLPSVSLQVATLRHHIDSRFDEVLEACKEACTGSAQQPAAPVSGGMLAHVSGAKLGQNNQETLKQLGKGSAEMVSELKLLQGQTSNMEERLMRHLAAKLTEQINGMEARLEARLLSMQQFQSTSLEPVLQQCKGLHVSLEGQKKTTEVLFAEQRKSAEQHWPPASDSIHCGRAVISDVDTVEVPRPHDDPTDFQAVAGCDEAACSRRPSNLSEAAATRRLGRSSTLEVTDLMQTLGWSTEVEEQVPDQVDEPEEDVNVRRCRTYLHLVSMLLVAVNTIFMGIAAEATLACAIQKEPRPAWAHLGDLIFFLLFVCELLLRLALDKRKFCIGPEVGWNVADVVATVFMGLEVAFSVGSNASFMRAVRLFRFIRAIRALEVFRFFKTVRLMLLSFQDAIWPLTYGLVLLLFILYLAALGVSQFVEQYISENGSSEDLLELYGSLGAIMFTFSMAIMSGAEWRRLLQPLQAMSGFLVFLFVLIQVFAVLGIMNLLNAIIVDGVIRNSQTNERLAMSARMLEQKSAVGELRQLLLGQNPSSTGAVARSAVAKVLKGDGKQYLEMMGLQVQNSIGLLKLLDTEEAGCVLIEEFLCSLSQLQAENMSVHMTTTIYESRKILQSIAALRRLMEEMSGFQAMAGDRVKALPATSKQ